MGLEKMHKASNRFFELDVFRGIAAFAVVLYHYTTWYDVNYKHSSELHFYFPLGHQGVELFFLISGFVMLLTLERTKTSLDFMVGRFSRLYPPYWAAIILTFTVVKITQLPIKPSVSFGEALFNLTMLQGFFKIPHVDGVYWTLTVELCFYITMFVVYRAKLLKYIEVIATGWFVIALCYSLTSYAFHWGWFSGMNPEVHYASISQVSVDYPLMTTGFGNHYSGLIKIFGNLLVTILVLKFAHLFIAGMMLYREKQQGFSAYRWLLIGACVLKQRVAYSWENSWQTTLIVAGCILLFYLALQGYLRFINLKPLIFMGTISYSLYLTHQNIGYALIRMLYQYNFNPYISIFLAICISILLATTMTFFVEQPAMNFIRGQYKKRALVEKSTS
ncbi:acyltransferase [Microcoleus sp. FACHB-53]|nr:acyltransferase [Microcoleus sp. FACHB-53]